MESIARENRITLNVKWSSVLRVLSIGINLLMVPLLLQFLGKAEYGIWLTITSFLGWSALLDLGIGNGLKNKLSEALANQRYDELKSYTSSAYAVITIITLVAFLVFLCVALAIDWSSIIGATDHGEWRLKVIMILFFLFFCIKIILNQLVNIASAKQQTAVGDLVNLLINIACLSLVVFCQEISSDKLMTVMVIFGFVPILVLGVLSLIAFSNRYKEFRPSFSAIDFSKAKEVMNQGAQFFVIQIAGIVLFSTDNLLISHYLGPEAVTPYHISFKYFGLVMIVFALLSTPMWPAYTEAYEQRDFRWITKTTKRLIRFWMMVALLVIGMFLVAPIVYRLWVGDQVQISWQLSAIMALYVITLSWGSIFVTFINSTGKLRLQLICSAIAGIANIPLSIYFVKYTELGSVGVMLSTIICLFYGPIISVIQYRKLVTKTAKGIWNK